jgi:hypothetical protein
MRPFILIVAMIGAVTAKGAFAGGPQYGLGIKSCAEFARTYAANPEVTETLYFAWAEGFMSGINVKALSEHLTARDIEGSDEKMAEYKSIIRSYCNAHPLATYSAAVVDLYVTLPLSRQTN